MNRFAMPLVAALLCASAYAVTPATWNQATEAEFEKGQFKGTVVNSAGEVRLGRDIEMLLAPDAAPAVLSAVAVSGKTVYAAGSDGQIYRIEDGKAAPYAKTPGLLVNALAVGPKGLLAATGGDEAGVYLVGEDGQVSKLWSDAAVKYVWALALAGDGTLYAGTGPQAKVFAIDAKGQAQAVYEAGKLAKNILSLALDGRMLYAGTDENGLVVEIDTARKTSRIVLDADEKEISVLVSDGKGGLYAATSDASKAGGDSGASPSLPGRASPEAPASSSAPAEDAEADGAEGGEGDTEAEEAVQEAMREFEKSQGPRPVSGGEALAVAVSAKAGGATSAPAASASQPASQPAEGGPAKAKSAGPGASPADEAPALSRRGGRGPAGAGEAHGNAVYFIRPDGLVEVKFRRPVAILSLVRQGGRLILGTGNGGVVYAVAETGDDVTRLADTDAKQVTALAQTVDGRLVFATANKGSVGVMGAGFAPRGVFLSDTLDARQLARWGTLRLWAQMPKGAKATIATRSGNVADPDDKTWSQWSDESPADGDFQPVRSPAGRYFQYRLTLTGDGQATPVVRQVRVIYQVGNLAPALASVTVQASAKGKDGRGGGADENAGPMMFRIVTIQASDPNNDALVYNIFFREMGQENWVRIAENLTENRFVWDTRTVGDGAYELKVVAGDSPANPPAVALEAARIAEPLDVDNTAPAVRELAAKIVDGKLSVSGAAQDAFSRIASIAYAVNSADEWKAVLPTDGICDSDNEKFSFDVTDLKPGNYRIAVRAVDVFGNTGYATVSVKIPQ